MGLKSSSGLGYGQAWVGNGAGITRAASTTYTNSTGKPIEVRITSGSIGTFIVNGLSVSSINTASSVVQVGGVVPPGGTYSWTASFGNWFELR